MGKRTKIEEAPVVLQSKEVIRYLGEERAVIGIVKVAIEVNQGIDIGNRPAISLNLELLELVKIEARQEENLEVTLGQGRLELNWNCHRGKVLIRIGRNQRLKI